MLRVWKTRMFETSVRSNGLHTLDLYVFVVPYYEIKICSPEYTISGPCYVLHWRRPIVFSSYLLISANGTHMNSHALYWHLPESGLHHRHLLVYAPKPRHKAWSTLLEHDHVYQQPLRCTLPSSLDSIPGVPLKVSAASERCGLHPSHSQGMAVQPHSCNPFH